ncbi:type 1 fimbrial protein [Escherichia coli]|uniref:Type 1 fimbrial protein n=1 Tax=Escherichia coli TaxID=562 RepID=A0A5N8H3Q1_ECOLX|nr:fimbrial protein [Escherichia coli]EFP8750611.1 type 1 fimbrial protein [Shigella flexneri]EEQ1662378.1 type 1 fimbrial protein [Escherichia coli]EEQ3957437.1 type 1 fimbrial protein [Escherichia coli]EER0854908.1 type 1 fimbrial protein [Escherichia coli]EER5477474.1 type 1 fimbrial protein [Escherichia coli]
MRNVRSATSISGVAGCLSLLLALPVGAVNITFDGELLDRPCQIDYASLNQTVQFLERPAKDFHESPGKGPAEKFNIRLIQCNANTIWKTVKLKFNGNRESAMKEQADYFLKVTGVNAGKLAIGLLDTDGITPLKLGDAHNRGMGNSVNRDALQFDFKAYVQATPDAIAQKSVQPGEYKSVVNFELVYE